MIFGSGWGESDEVLVDLESVILCFVVEDVRERRIVIM